MCSGYLDPRLQKRRGCGGSGTTPQLHPALMHRGGALICQRHPRTTSARTPCGGLAGVAHSSDMVIVLLNLNVPLNTPSMGQNIPPSLNSIGTILVSSALISVALFEPPPVVT